MYIKIDIEWNDQPEDGEAKFNQPTKGFFNEREKIEAEEINDVFVVGQLFGQMMDTLLIEGPRGKMGIFRRPSGELPRQ